MVERSMSEFWDARAEEDAFYFVDNDLRYGDPDVEWFWARGVEIVDKVLEATGTTIEPGDEIVEIGCGVGRLTRPLAERGASVRALDVSAAMLERARELNPGLENVDWIHGDGETLTSVADASADACFSWVVFQHIPDPEVTLGYVREMGRVLRPGGWSVFQISDSPGVHEPRSATTRLKDTVRSLAGRGPGGQHHPAWLGSAIDLGRLREVAAEAGMDTERIVGEGTQHCLVMLRRRPAGG
jgi:SAM-dependent methyltransferase